VSRLDGADRGDDDHSVAIQQLTNDDPFRQLLSKKNAYKQFICIINV